MDIAFALLFTFSKRSFSEWLIRSYFSGYAKGLDAANTEQMWIC